MGWEQYLSKRSGIAGMLERLVFRTPRGSGLLGCFAILGITTLLGQLLHKLGISDVNIIIVYLLGILFMSVILVKQRYLLLMSVACVIIFNFFFTEPKYTLLAYDPGYPVTFLFMFVASMLTGTLAAMLKEYAVGAAQGSYRTRVLLDTSQMLARTHQETEITNIAIQQIFRLTGKDLSLILPDADALLQERNNFPSGGQDRRNGRENLPVREQKSPGAAQQEQRTGREWAQSSIDFEDSLIRSILNECAMAIENERNYREKEAVHVMAENERLRANLLRTISHDLRSPLTSISGNASNLLNNMDAFDQETRTRICRDIYDDSMWLIQLVENLLAISRINDGKMNIHMSTELLEEVIRDALKHVDRRKSEHQIRFREPEELILVKMDARLFLQVIINIVNNAIKYTQQGSRILISARREEGDAVIRIQDNGPGIPEGERERVFDMFYTGEQKAADSQRSLGLGLALCKSIIDVHHGSIRIEDAVWEDTDPENTLSGGTCFVIRMRAEEVPENE